MDINQFFQPEKTSLAEQGYDTEPFRTFLLATHAYGRVAHNSLYIIDNKLKGFAYVSDNPLFLCGHSAPEVKEMGYSFFLKQAPREDLELLLAGAAFFESLSVEERLLYSISYDFHLIRADGFALLVNHRLTPLYLEAGGDMRFALCTVSVSPHKNAGNILARKSGERTFYRYSTTLRKWEKQDDKTITEKERLLVYLSAQGYSMREISQKTNLSPNTIKFHKRNLFKKLGVVNISEAIAVAASYQNI